MTETEDYAGETEGYAIPAGETPFTGEDITGEEGALVMDIPSARYPEGKTATAKDADLTAGNIKSGVDIFSILGTLEGETDVLPESIETGLSHAIT